MADTMLSLKRIALTCPGFSLKDISLKVERGEYFMLLGRSGSGKSMLLEVISGIKKPEAGQIMLNNRDITHKPVQQRRAILMHQSTNLFPHLTVFNNIAFPLRCLKLPTKEIRSKVEELADIVSVKTLLHSYPATLSGGEAQRTALARALTVKPDILLLDEPLAALDIMLHGDLKSLLMRINKNGQTILHVTHNYEEVLSLAHKLAVIDNGEIIQVGSAAELEKNPKSGFVARLAGIKNFFPVTRVDSMDADDYSIAHLEGNVKCIVAGIGPKNSSNHLIIDDKAISIMRHPHKSQLSNFYKGTIIDIIPGSDDYGVVINIGFKIIASYGKELFRASYFEPGDEVWVEFPPDACRLTD